MGLSDESDEAIEQKYEELCLDLNMDRTAKQNAWEAFQRIRVNYTLEVGLNVQTSHVCFEMVSCHIYMTLFVHKILSKYSC